MDSGAHPHRLSSNAPHSVQFFQRHIDDDPNRSAPGYAFIESCPARIGDKMLAVLKAVAEAPPKRFSGGGYWEAMHDTMTGWHEVRVDGGKPRAHYRLFCVLDNAAFGVEQPALVVITGLRKPLRTTFNQNNYRAVVALGDEYFGRNPRSWLSG